MVKQAKEAKKERFIVIAVNVCKGGTSLPVYYVTKYIALY